MNSYLKNSYILILGAIAISYILPIPHLGLLLSIFTGAFFIIIYIVFLTLDELADQADITSEDISSIFKTHVMIAKFLDKIQDQIIDNQKQIEALKEQLKTTGSS